MEAIYEKIHNQRRKKGMTQIKLSELTGVSNVTICKLEKGFDINFKALKKICDVLGMKIEVVEI